MRLSRSAVRKSVAITTAAIGFSTLAACYPSSQAGLSWPMVPRGILTQGFSGGHSGIDVAAPYGAPVIAATAGRVSQAGPYYGYGNYICIQRDASLRTCYAHLASINVRAGQPVFQGQVIGNEGSTGESTGAHLMFEVYLNGRAVNPLAML